MASRITSTQLSEYIIKLSGQIESLTSMMEMFKDKIFGNGQQGVLDRVTKIEDNITQLCSATQSNTTAIEVLKKTISDLAVITKEHRDNKQLHSLIGLSSKKEVIVWIVVGFTFLHSFVSSIPDISIIIRWLFGILGIKLP